MNISGQYSKVQYRIEKYSAEQNSKVLYSTAECRKEQ